MFESVGRSRAGGWTSNGLILLVGIFILGLDNASFFGQVLKTYGWSAGTAAPLAALAAVIGAATVALPALLAFGRATKPVLMLYLLLAALAAYFMDSYGIVINDEMLQNAAQTNPGEARDLINLKLLGYVFGLGVLPAFIIGRMRLAWRGWRTELFARFKLFVALLVIMVGLVLLFGSFFASFAREHKSLRAYANPTYPIYSAIKYANSQFAAPADQTVKAIGLDARTPPADIHRELVILVVGETARADHFSLNGYGRETNPRLQALDVVSLTDFRACGTSTAVSVPCMFSLAGSTRIGAGMENLLDVLQRAGVNILWLDNNSDSKGVATRVSFQDFRVPANNPLCDTECRDVGMLPRLQAFIDSHPTGDIVVVLHQMGNHGPAYYKRYPPAYEKFKPACQSNDLSQCSKDEIGNAYDNAILYTDFFLSKLIETLKRYDDRFETAMFYLSDHGESLGENGVYLHGFPYALAPEAQRHVPAILWFGQGFDDVDLAALRKKQGALFSQDNLFHTLLGMLEIDSAAYRKNLDILDGARNPHHP